MNNFRFMWEYFKLSSENNILIYKECKEFVLNVYEDNLFTFGLDELIECFKGCLNILSVTYCNLVVNERDHSCYNCNKDSDSVYEYRYYHELTLRIVIDILKNNLIIFKDLNPHQYMVLVMFIEFHLLNIETQNFYQELSLIKNFDEWNYKLSGRLQRIILLENYKKVFSTWDKFSYKENELKTNDPKNFGSFHYNLVYSVKLDLFSFFDIFCKSDQVKLFLIKSIRGNYYFEQYWGDNLVGFINDHVLDFCFDNKIDNERNLTLYYCIV